MRASPHPKRAQGRAVYGGSADVASTTITLSAIPAQAPGEARHLAVRARTAILQANPADRAGMYDENVL